MMRLLFGVALVLAMFLAGCGGLAKLTGDERGGMIDLSGTNEQEVFEAAETHCRSFGKAAKITSIQKQDGGSVLFDCI